MAFKHIGSKVLTLLFLFACISAVLFGQDITAKVHLDTINGKVPLALAHLWGQTLSGLTQNPFVFEMASVEIQNNSSQARTLQLKLELEGLGSASMKTVEVGPMAKVVVQGSPVLDWNVVRNYVDAREAKLSIVLQEGQSVVYSDMLNVPLMGKDDIPMYANSKPLYFFLVTRVQPKSRLVSQILSTASQKMGLKWKPGIFEYQGANNPDQAKEDVRKIYETIQAMDFTFDNKPVSFEEGYHRIKTPTEALQTRKGNCIDGTLVFASCIAAIGYNPILVLVPGHVLVIASMPPADLSGTRPARRHFQSMTLDGGRPSLATSFCTAWFPIETTVLQIWSRQTLTMTRTSFEGAMLIGERELSMAGPAKVALIDVEAWRACGLLPVPER